jgi:hypothetical protein
VVGGEELSADYVYIRRLPRRENMKRQPGEMFYKLKNFRFMYMNLGPPIVKTIV